MLIVDLHFPNPDQINAMEPILSASSAFIRHGIHIRDRRNMPFDIHGANLIITRQELLKSSNVDIPTPIILFEHLDCATFNYREFAEHPNVKAILKIATMRPPEVQNVYKGRYHAYLLHQQRSIPKELSAEALAKLHPAPNYSAFSFIEPLANMPIDLDGPRSIDVHFRGTLNYGKRDSKNKDHHAITAHRHKALEVVQKFPNSVGSDRAIGRDEYYAELHRTKVVVSPWGFGELCWRDAEAFYAGCVLVKPNSDYVRTWPDMFRADSYVPCRPDLEDLEEKINYVLSNWDQFKEMRRRNRELLLTHRTKEAITNHYGNLFLRCLGK